VLVQANETKRPVRITLVRTRRDETFVGDDNSEVFLVATNQSTATFLTTKEEVEFAKHEEESAASSTQLQHQTQLPFSSCSQQDHQHHHHHHHHHQQQTRHHSFNRTTRKVRASVRQIVLDQDETADSSITHPYSLNERSTTQECFNFLSRILYANNDNTDAKGKTCKFTLELQEHRQMHQQTQDCQQDENHNTRSSTPHTNDTTVFVSSTLAILERLCGGDGSFSGILPDMDDDQQQEQEQQQQKRRYNNTDTMLANVLQALLTNQVQLEWSILTGHCQQQPGATTLSNQPNLHGGVVQDVTLPAI
jgi:hypothetical protein